MKFTLLKNFISGDIYEGIPGEDNHGKYIFFPPEIRDIITASDFLRTESGDTIQIQEETSEVLNGTRFLKLYYK